MDQNTQRLDKYLANLGICSRRNVENLLKKQELMVNGKRAQAPGLRINPLKDTIRLNGKEIQKPHLVYYLLNKPRGIVSTASDEFGRKNILSLVRSFERIYPVGRLDKDTSGLIILTNDGDLTNLLTHPKFHIDKVYRLTVFGKVNKNQLKAIRNGVELKDGKTAPAEAKIIQEGLKTSVLEITLHEGRNRQIRRMCEKVKIHIADLARVKIGTVEIGDLKEGRHRMLTEKEVEELKLS